MKHTSLSFFTPITAIAKATLFEQLRNKLLLAVLLIGVLATTASFFFGTISFDATSRVVQNLGLAAIQVCVVLISAIATTNSISHDEDRRVWYMLFSKPVSRAQYILGKFAGMNGLLLAMLLILGTVFSVGIITLDTSLLGNVWITLVYTFLETSFVIALGILFASFTAPLNATLYTLALTLIAHSSASVRDFLGTIQISVWAKYVADFVYYLLPNFAKFNVRRTLLYGMTIPAESFLTSLLYWAIYTSLIIALSVQVLKKREV